jgi:hypothetical protein
VKAPKKSPLKDRPLRYTGQSLDEEIDDLVNDKILIYFVAIILLGLATYMQWANYYKPITSPPILTTVIALLAFSFCSFQIYRSFRKLKALKLGRDGERAVGQYLELLREQGCRIFHDIVGSSFNIDHVIISKKGIFVIETKTYSKPTREKPQPVIFYDGEKILIDRHESKSDILTQVKASSSWLKGVIKESTGKFFDITPVIVFPGWYVESPGNDKEKIQVLNPKLLPAFISSRKDVLPQDDVMLVSYHISRYIRVARNK